MRSLIQENIILMIKIAERVDELLYYQNKITYSFPTIVIWRKIDIWLFKEMFYNMYDAFY